MHLPELEVNGLSYVTSIEDCPEIADGQGSVITGRFATREVNVIVRAEIRGLNGTIETIEGTTIHPIWSVDRRDWVPLSEMEEGESLQGSEGIATVLSIAILQTAVPVYNVEVHGEHVYEVSDLGALVHNASPDCAAALAKFPGSRVVDLRRIRIAPGGKEFADPENIARLGKFNWKRFEPLIVRIENGAPTLYEGMKRIELALRANITELPAYFLR